MAKTDTKLSFKGKYGDGIRWYRRYENTLRRAARYRKELQQCRDDMYLTKLEAARRGKRKVEQIIAERQAIAEHLWPGITERGRALMYWAEGDTTIVTKEPFAQRHARRELHVVCGEGRRKVFHWVDVPFEAGGGGEPLNAVNVD